jgi:hypothetical protein
MAVVYAQGLVNILTGTQNWPTDGWKAMLTLDSYAVNQETHQFLDDVSASRASGTTDQALTEVAPAVDTGNNRVEMDASNDPVWSSVTIGQSVGEVICYFDTGTPATSPLISYNDFSGGDIPCNGSDITVQFSAEGVWAVGY